MLIKSFANSTIVYRGRGRKYPKEEAIEVEEIEFIPYKKEDEKSREAQINAWLNSLEW